MVIDKLDERWSPEQISAWLAAEHHGDAGMQVSHETIYHAVYLQARGKPSRRVEASEGAAHRPDPPHGAIRNGRGVALGPALGGSAHQRPPGRGRGPSGAGALGG
ncbi:hypothetical protein EF847_08290 [Actinobacteria bacterium YIM 96077]|nr:hypothetical protein EF847_08290 [Actinobacteria bacterium YIM 96077]